MEVEIVLKSKDGQVFKIPKKHAELSILIKNVVQDYNNEAIEMQEVDAKMLSIVINYLNHFKGVAPLEIQKPLKSAILKGETDEWSANFIDNLTLDEIVDLSCAANYMEIQCLLDLVCAKIASMCKDKSPEELFTIFGVKEQFTEEDKQKIKDENKWIEDNL